MLDHIVKDEEGESESLDLSTCERGWDKLGLALVY